MQNSSIGRSDPPPTYCPVCETDTPHVERVRRDPRRSHENPAPPRLVKLCMDCGAETEVLGVRP